MGGAGNPNVQELLKAGITAARAGDKDKARELLQQVVELDEYSEQGWYWLASVVETEEERRTCLGNVVLINPQNAKAQALLDRLEMEAAGDAPGGGPALGEANRRNMMITVVAALALVVIAVIALNLGGGGNDDGSEANNGTGRPTRTATNTLSPEILSLTPPPPTRRLPPTLPPAASMTPTPERGGNVVQPTLPPLPENLVGVLLISSGNAFGNEEYQPVQLLDLSDPSVFVPATEDGLRGSSPSFAPDGTRYVFAQFNIGQRSVTLQIANMDGTNSRTLGQFWGFNPVLVDQAMPAWSPVADRVVFVARTTGGRDRDIYVVDTPITLPVPPPTNTPDFFSETATATLPALPDSLRQLTNDDVSESWPAWSPNGQVVIYVADTSLTGVEGIDLRVINVATGAIQYLTVDGVNFVESAPDWGGPDNNLVIYSASAAGSDESDIWIVSIDALTDTPPGPTPTADAAATEAPTEESAEAATPEATAEETTDSVDTGIAPRILIDLGPHDIQPRWSPDGQFIIFSSDYLSEDFDIFIYEVETGETFALTNSENIVDIANDWMLP